MAAMVTKLERGPRQKNQPAMQVYCAITVLLVLAVAGLTPSEAATNSFVFSYKNSGLLKDDGWSFIATTPAGQPRDTEATNGPVISYSQSQHPGTLRLPIALGDLWGSLNNSTNTLLRNLPSNWVSLRLSLSFNPTADSQQVHLACYQDDDNYVEIGTGWNSGRKFYFIQEVNAVVSPNSSAATSTNLLLRLDRDLSNGDLSGYYSLDRTNWIFHRKTSQALLNPRLAIWGGGYAGTSQISCDLRQLDIITSDAPVTTTLAVAPGHLVFSAVVGQPCSATQTLSVAWWGAAALRWTITNLASWISTDSTNGSDTGFCRVSVNTSGLTSGVYSAGLTVTSPGAINGPATIPVTLIVNPAARARVATWQGGHAAAMTVWTDDGNSTGFDALRTNGFTGTFVYNGTNIPPYAGFYAAGMDLGCHTVTHPCGVSLDEPGFRRELEPNIDCLCTRTAQPCDYLVSFAYPCGLTSPRMRTVAADYFLLARGYNINALEDASPADFMNLKSFNSHGHVPAPPADLKTVVDAALAQGKWFIMVLHQPPLADDGAIAYAAGKDVWGASGASVFKYILQRDRTVVTNYAEDSGSVRFGFYRLPFDSTSRRAFETSIRTNDLLTFQVDTAGLPQVSGLTVNGASVAYTNKTINGRSMLVFNALATTSVQSVVLQVNTNITPPIQILSLALVSNAAAVTWSSTAGNSYRLQYKTNLDSASWTDVVPDVVATGATATASQPLDTASGRFFRVMRAN